MEQSKTKRNRTAKVIILLGVVIVIASAVLWVINFYGIYGDVSQGGFSDAPSNATKLTGNKFNRQAHYRDIAEGAGVVGYIAIAGGIFLKAKAKNNR